MYPAGRGWTFSDLGRRKVDLQAIVCPAGSLGPNLASLPKGITRVH